MRLTHLGHACMLVEAAGTRILIDPGAFSGLWHGTEDLDGILVTHQHPDHVDPEHAPALVEANPHAAVYTADDVDQKVQLPRAHPAGPGQQLRIGAVDIETVGGQHAIIHADTPGCTMWATCCAPPTSRCSSTRAMPWTPHPKEWRCSRCR